MTDSSKTPSKSRIIYDMGDLSSRDETNTAKIMLDMLRKSVNNASSTNGELDVDMANNETDANPIASKLVFNPEQYNQNGVMLKNRSSNRLSDAELKDLANFDPYISAIISTRCVQGAQVGRESESKFDKGSKIQYKKSLSLKDFGNDQKKFLAEADKIEKRSKVFMEWVQNCGTTNQEILDEAFKGRDKTFKYCSFPEFITAQVRNLLTFGRCGTHIIRDRNTNEILMFRPIAIEVVKGVEDGHNVHISRDHDRSNTESLEDAAEYNATPPDQRPLSHVMEIDGQYVQFFTENDFVMWYYQKQSLFGLKGYMLSPIELAIHMVFLHTQTMGYLRNQFIKGLGSKAILVVSPRDVASELNELEVNDLRNTFHNYMTRNDNSAAMPVLSGNVDVRVETLMSSPKDMEYLQVEDHVIRALCSAFQISPQEMGYGHLSQGQGGISQANKQEELIQGEERGLRQLLDVIFDGVNDILVELFPEAADYKLCYTGVGEDTKDAVVNRNAAELNTTATMSSLWANSEKKDPFPFGGDVPLATAFHQNVAKYMFYGDLLEHFFGVEGASKKPEFKFIIDPTLNSAYMQLLSTTVEMQKESAKIGLEMSKAQLDQTKNPPQPAAPQPEADGQQPQGEPQQQSPQETDADKQQPGDQQGQPAEDEKDEPLIDRFRQASDLKKSMTSYFECWLNAHNTPDDE